MSRGIGARAHKISEDDTEVTYEYGGYNLNKPGFENPSHLYDGRIRILKCCFLSQMIYDKTQRKANNRKKSAIKHSTVSVAYWAMIALGLIEIENCSNCWSTAPCGGFVIDRMVGQLLSSLFADYLKTGKIPDHAGYDV